MIKTLDPSLTIEEAAHRAYCHYIKVNSKLGAILIPVECEHISSIGRVVFRVKHRHSVTGGGHAQTDVRLDGKRIALKRLIALAGQ